MLLAPCAVETVIGVSSMKKSWRSTQPKGIEDHLKDLCIVYRGEMDTLTTSMHFLTRSVPSSS